MVIKVSHSFFFLISFFINLKKIKDHSAHSAGKGGKSFDQEQIMQKALMPELWFLSGYCVTRGFLNIHKRLRSYGPDNNSVSRNIFLKPR